MSSNNLSLGLRMSFAGMSLCENTIMNLVYPILPFMVEFYMKDSYAGGVPEDVISAYSGYMEGWYRLMQFLACLWM